MNYLLKSFRFTLILLITTVLVVAHQSEQSGSVQTKENLDKSGVKPLSSVNEVLDIPFVQFQQGVLLNILNSNIVRFGNYRTLLNLSAGKQYSVKPIINPASKKEGLGISVFLFSSQADIITETDVLDITDALLVEVQNSFGYFGKTFDMTKIYGVIQERLNEGKQGRQWDISKLIRSLRIQKTLVNFSNKILSMGYQEQLMRTGKLEMNQTLRIEHLESLKKIVGTIGWPTIQQVGASASHMAWSIVQHADFDLKYQKLVLDVLKQANQGQIMISEIPFLTDRILLNEGKKQLYGTQYEVDKQGNIIPRPIKSLNDVDERRKEYGLIPFNEYLASLKKAFVKKKEEM